MSDSINYRYENLDGFEGIDEMDSSLIAEESSFHDIPENCPFLRSDITRMPPQGERPPVPPPRPPQQGPQGPPPPQPPMPGGIYGQPGQQQHGYPMPPRPPRPVNTFALRRCMFRTIYIWPRRGPGFFAWLNNAGRNTVSGYRWNGRRWELFAMDIRDIQRFRCY